MDRCCFKGRGGFQTRPYTGFRILLTASLALLAASAGWIGCGRGQNSPVRVTVVQVRIEPRGVVYCQGERVSWRGLQQALLECVRDHDHVVVATTVDPSILPEDAKVYLEKILRCAERAGAEAFRGNGRE